MYKLYLFSVELAKKLSTIVGDIEKSYIFASPKKKERILPM